MTATESTLLYVLGSERLPLEGRQPATLVRCLHLAGPPPGTRAQLAQGAATFKVHGATLRAKPDAQLVTLLLRPAREVVAMSFLTSPKVEGGVYEPTTCPLCGRKE